MMVSAAARRLASGRRKSSVRVLIRERSTCRVTSRKVMTNAAPRSPAPGSRLIRQWNMASSSTVAQTNSASASGLPSPVLCWR